MRVTFVGDSRVAARGTPAAGAEAAGAVPCAGSTGADAGRAAACADARVGRLANAAPSTALSDFVKPLRSTIVLPLNRAGKTRVPPRHKRICERGDHGSATPGRDVRRDYTATDSSRARCRRGPTAGTRLASGTGLSAGWPSRMSRAALRIHRSRDKPGRHATNGGAARNSSHHTGIAAVQPVRKAVHAETSLSGPGTSGDLAARRRIDRREASNARNNSPTAAPERQSWRATR